jgi:hypothetical protein
LTEDLGSGTAWCLWQALTGASCLDGLTWDALAHEGPFPARQLRGCFSHQPLDLPILQQLVVRAPSVTLPPSFSLLSSLTELQVACYQAELARGCLPHSLLNLAVEWLPTMTPVTTHPEHLAMLAAAAAGVLGFARLRVQRALSCAELEL